MTSYAGASRTADNAETPRGGIRLFQMLRNLRLAGLTAWQHITDDPVVLALQLSRRMPAAGIQPLARAVLALAGPNGTATPVLMASAISGDHSDVARRLERAANRKTGAERARRLADVALATNLLEYSDALLVRAGRSRKYNAAAARRHWHDGALSEAVAILAGSGRDRRFRARLRGELAVFRGAAPSLERRDYTPEPGKVLHLLTNSLPHTTSGYAQRSHSLLAAQQAAGWDVLAVTRLGYPVQVGKLRAGLRDVVEGVEYARLLPSSLAPTLDRRLQQQAEELLQIALRFRPSVLHTTTHFVNGVVVRAVAEALNIPWVYEVRGQLADTWASTRGAAAHESEKFQLFQQRETELMVSADLVVTLGEAMKANIIAAGIPGEKILLAPNAVGGEYLKSPQESIYARRQLGLPEGGPFIGTVSSLVQYEGIDDLITAFELLAPHHPELRLMIVGDGTSSPSLQRQARGGSFGDRIIFTGRVPRDQARTFHEALDVFVVPRKDLDVTRSVTPLKPVEALACARPVVASRLEALEEIVDDGVNGFTAQAENPDDLAAKLERLLDSGELRTLLGQTGRRRVLKSRTWEANALTLARAYGELVEARN